MARFGGCFATAQGRRVYTQTGFAQATPISVFTKTMIIITIVIRRSDILFPDWSVSRNGSAISITEEENTAHSIIIIIQYFHHHHHNSESKPEFRNLSLKNRKVVHKIRKLGQIRKVGPKNPES